MLASCKDRGRRIQKKVGTNKPNKVNLINLATYSRRVILSYHSGHPSLLIFKFGYLKAIPDNSGEFKQELGNRIKWWPETESNRRHDDSQPSDLPNDLSDLMKYAAFQSFRLPRSYQIR